MIRLEVRNYKCAFWLVFGPFAVHVGKFWTKWTLGLNYAWRPVIGLPFRAFTTWRD